MSRSSFRFRAYWVFRVPGSCSLAETTESVEEEDD